MTPAEVSLYALRHCNIVEQNATSIATLERTYSALSALTRARWTALLNTGTAVDGNVVPLRV
jgi:hypothetical protein